MVAESKMAIGLDKMMKHLEKARRIRIVRKIKSKSIIKMRKSKSMMKMRRMITHTKVRDPLHLVVQV